MIGSDKAGVTQSGPAHIQGAITQKEWVSPPESFRCQVDTGSFQRPREHTLGSKDQYGSDGGLRKSQEPGRQSVWG